MGFFTAIVLLVVVVLLIPNLRQQWVTGPAFRLFKKVLPPLTQTEKEAMEAGGVWWEAKLFSGQANWHDLLQMQLPGLSQEEQEFINEKVPRLMALLDDFKAIHTDKDFSPEAWEYIRDNGFFSLIIPKEYGGKAFSAIANSTIVSLIASRSQSAAVTVMVPNSLGPGELLSHYGTQQQKDYWLPRLAAGTDIPCFALTGPNAGSDAGSIPDSGIVCYGEHNSERCLGIKLNWDKRYITLAPVATVLGLAFKLHDPEHILGDKDDIGITCALIPTSHPGVVTGDRHLPLEQAFMNGTTYGKDVFIPLDWIIGGPDYAGKGWRMLIECLSAGRGISLPALATGNGHLCAHTTSAYSLIRRQFGLPLGEFEGVQEALGRIGANAYALDAMRTFTAGAIDLGQKPAVVTAIAKYHMTELARESINDAMDVHGGKGIQMGPNNYLASQYMAMPIAITVEGANILTRSLMIFGQGATRCHPYVMDEMVAAGNPDEQAGLKAFEPLLGKHIIFAAKNVAATLFHGLTGARFASSPTTDFTSGYYRQLGRMSKALAVCSDIAMLFLGGELKRKEMLSARLGDVLSQLYISSAVLKRFENQGSQANDKLFVQYNLNKSLYKSELALREFCENFPVSWVGFILKRIIFPYGVSFKAPSDELATGISHALMYEPAIRQRISDLCYVGDESDSVAELEQTYQGLIKLRPIENKITTAQKQKLLPRKGSMFNVADAALEQNIISQSEHTLLVSVGEQVAKCVAVDSFNAL